MGLYFQIQQAVNLFVLLFLGKFVANIYLPFYKIIAILLFTVLIEHFYLYLIHKKIHYFSFSSLTTAIGVMLMMATPHLWIYMVVIGIGLFQKHFLKVDGRHFFNPSNFALLFGLLFYYDDAHMVLGQLSDVLWLNVVVGILAVVILVRVERWMIPIAFVVSYLILQSVLVVAYDPVMIFDDVTYRFYSVSFIVFVLFMLTDPKTTPSNIGHQLVFSFLLALIAVMLDRYQGFRVQHLFMALFLLSLFVPIINGWGETKDKKKWVLVTSFLIVFALSVTIVIEKKAPYYFEMNN